MKSLFLDFAQCSLQNIIDFIVVRHHSRLFALVKFMSVTLICAAGLLFMHLQVCVCVCVPTCAECLFAVLIYLRKQE